MTLLCRLLTAARLNTRALLAHVGLLAPPFSQCARPWLAWEVTRVGSPDVRSANKLGDLHRSWFKLGFSRTSSESPCAMQITWTRNWTSSSRWTRSVDLKFKLRWCNWPLATEAWHGCWLMHRQNYSDDRLMWCEWWQALEALNKKDITEIKSYGSLWCYQCLVYLTVTVLATEAWHGCSLMHRQNYSDDRLMWCELWQALEALNKKDITEIKSYGKPPPLVEKVLEAVMILRGNEPTWAEAKRQLGTLSFWKFTVILSAKFHLMFSSSLSWTCSLSRSIGVLVVTSVKYVFISTTEAVSSCDTACALLLLRLNF